MWVGLGVTQRLRVSQHVVERTALLSHLRQDEVCGAVDDASEPLDSIAGESFADGFDDGIPPATADSNATVTPFACAAAKISLPCNAISALLAYHMFARSNRFENEFTRQLRSTH